MLKRASCPIGCCILTDAPISEQHVSVLVRYKGREFYSLARRPRVLERVKTKVEVETPDVPDRACLEVAIGVAGDGTRTPRACQRSGETSARAWRLTQRCPYKASRLGIIASRKPEAPPLRTNESFCNNGISVQLLAGCLKR